MAKKPTTPPVTPQTPKKPGRPFRSGYRFKEPAQKQEILRDQICGLIKTTTPDVKRIRRILAGTMVEDVFLEESKGTGDSLRLAKVYATLIDSIMPLLEAPKKGTVPEDPKDSW